MFVYVPNLSMVSLNSITKKKQLYNDLNMKVIKLNIYFVYFLCLVFKKKRKFLKFMQKKILLLRIQHFSKFLILITQKKNS